MYRNSRLFLILFLGGILCCKIAVAGETKLICQVHIKSSQGGESEGEMDTKALVWVLEDSKNFAISLETINVFIDISNFPQSTTQDKLLATKTVKIDPLKDMWSASRKGKTTEGDDVQDRITVDRTSGFVNFTVIFGTIRREGAGQCEKVNSKVNKF